MSSTTLSLLNDRSGASPVGRLGLRLWRSRVRLAAFGAAAIAATLIGCGGGGADAPGIAPTPVPPQPSLTVALTDLTGTATRSTVAVGAPIAATATLRSGTGAPIANTIVQFAINNASGTTGTVAVLSPPSGNGVTDDQGRFTVVVYAAGYEVQGAASIVATTPTLSSPLRGSADFQVARTGSPVTTTGAVFTMALVDPVSGAARNALSQGQPVTARATLRNGAGQPIPNTLVQFSLTATGTPTPPAVLSPDVGAVITDAAGTAAVSIIAANADAQGAGTVAVTAPNLSPAPSTNAAFQVVRANAPDPTLAPVVTLALTDPISGAVRNSLSVNGPLTATATVRSGTGTPIPNAIVQFGITLPAGVTQPIAVLSPAAGNGLTDSQGRFAVSLVAAGVESQGPGTLTARALGLSATPPEAAANFQVNRPTITLEDTTWDPPTIDAFQTATIRVRVSGVAPTFPVRVSFTSNCVTNGKAELPASVLTVNGVASATYVDKGCSQRDTITISTAGAASVQTTLDVRPPPAVAVQFVSATPTTISISGVGGGSVSQVVFRVVSAANQPVANASVTLSLETAVGGVTLDGQPGPLTKVSGADGTVSVGVAAGTQPGPVRVRAALGTGPSALSSQIAIQTGLPTQSRFSLSVETFNIQGWNYDGITTGLTIRAADRAGNPAPDGTVVNFRSSGAAIQPSCQLKDGVCTVTFTSQANRPANGRVAVLSWAIGEESFTDSNGNNRYDPGESFGDLGDVFVDANLNGIFDAGEDFIRYNPNANAACAASPLAVVGRPDSCDGVWGLAHIRRSTQIVLSGNQPVGASVPASLSVCSALGTPGQNYTDARTFSFTLRDLNGNPMPAGTVVEPRGVPQGVTVTVVAGSPVPSTLEPTSVLVSVQATCTCPAATPTPTPAPTATPTPAPTPTGTPAPTPTPTPVPIATPVPTPSLVRCTGPTGFFFLVVKTPAPALETVLGPIGF